MRHVLTALTLCTILISTSQAQEPPARGGGGRAGAGAGARATRPPLFFREEWKEAVGGGEKPVDATQTVSSANLELKLYGPGGKDIQVTGTANNESNPVHLWTGVCEQLCAAALRDKENFVDLTGLAMIRWVTKVSGFHQVHPILKLADGTWLVGDHAEGPTIDWRETEFAIADVRWRKLDIKLVVEREWVDRPDLSKVDEIGWTDLMTGGGTPASSRVDWIEVYGKPVTRQ